jgi:hypothetical protein
VQLVGVNDVGYEAGNLSITSNRKLPWLQATAMVDVWEQWKPTFRDVVVLDGEGRVVAIFNLSANDLSNPANYQALKALLIDAANKN